MTMGVGQVYQITLNTSMYGQENSKEPSPPYTHNKPCSAFVLKHICISVWHVSGMLYSACPQLRGSQQGSTT